jgi:hypothetical protein
MTSRGDGIRADRPAAPDARLWQADEETATEHRFMAAIRVGVAIFSHPCSDGNAAPPDDMNLIS